MDDMKTTPNDKKPDLSDPNRIVTAIAVGQVNSMQAQAVLGKLKAGNGYCPCKIQATPDTKCQCKEFRDNLEKLRKYAEEEPDPHFNFSCICSCGLFVGQVVKASFSSLPPEIQAQVSAQELERAKMTGGTADCDKEDSVDKNTAASKDNVVPFPKKENNSGGSGLILP